MRPRPSSCTWPTARPGPRPAMRLHDPPRGRAASPGPSPVVREPTDRPVAESRTLAAADASRAQATMACERRPRQTVLDLIRSSAKAAPRPQAGFRQSTARWQPTRWSSTRPQACISAYIVVGPTKTKPARLERLGQRRATPAVGAGTSDDPRRPRRRGRSARTTRAARSRRPRPRPRAGRPRPARWSIVAATLARLRTMPASSISRSTSRSSNAATARDREAGEGRAERRPLAQDREPGQPGLERLQGQPLEEPVVAVHRPAPLVVVVGRGSPASTPPRRSGRARPRRRRRSSTGAQSPSACSVSTAGASSTQRDGHARPEAGGPAASRAAHAAQRQVEPSDHTNRARPAGQGAAPRRRRCRGPGGRCAARRSGAAGPRR